MEHVECMKSSRVPGPVCGFVQQGDISQWSSTDQAVLYYWTLWTTARSDGVFQHFSIVFTYFHQMFDDFCPSCSGGFRVLCCMATWAELENPSAMDVAAKESKPLRNWPAEAPLSSQILPLSVSAPAVLSKLLVDRMFWTIESKWSFAPREKNPSRSRTWKQFNAAEILDILRQFVNPCDICDILWHLPVLGNLFHTFWKGVQHSKDLVAKFRLHFGLHQLNELLSSSRVKVNGFGWGPPHARSHIRQRWKLWSILVLDMQNHETNWTNMKEQITTPWSNCLEMPEKLQTHIIMLRQPLVEISDSHLGSHLLKTWSIGIGICNLRHLRYEHTLQGPWPSAVRAFIMPEHFFCEWYWSPIISLSCFSDLQYWTKYAICTAVPTLTQRIHLGDHNFSLRANGKQTNTVKYK